MLKLYLNKNFPSFFNLDFQGIHLKKTVCLGPSVAVFTEQKVI